jgi:hypothetical protein
VDVVVVSTETTDDAATAGGITGPLDRTTGEPASVLYGRPVRARRRYRKIQHLLGVTYTWLNRHVTRGQALKRAEAAAAAEVEAAVRDAA